MMKKIIILFWLQFFISGCYNQISINQNNSFNKHKSNFRKDFIKHFPDEIKTQISTIASGANMVNHDVGLLLYEYEMKQDDILEAKEKIKGKIIAQYKSDDSCLLIVNRFETRETYENREIAEIMDSSLLNQERYKGLYPIPNFMDYSVPNDNSDIKLPAGFDIYVLEAKAGNHFKKYKMEENYQMPDNWKNGYSRGVAINEEEKTVIYWSIIW